MPVPPQPVKRAPKPIVVVADDDMDNLKIITVKLESHGIQVITVRDGQGALAAVRQYRPALILLDVMMPRLNGFQVARMIKFDTQLKGTPVIIMTVRTEDVDRATGIQVGADEYLQKPYDPETLLARVQYHVERWRAAQASAEAEPPPAA